MMGNDKKKIKNLKNDDSPVKVQISCCWTVIIVPSFFDDFPINIAKMMENDEKMMTAGNE